MSQIETFFRLLFGPSASGYVCIATLTPSKDFKEYYFEYPTQLSAMAECAEEHAETRNVYVCPQILAGPKRSRAGVKVCPNVWADLEECRPDQLLVQPTLTIESSRNRYQAYWILEEPADPDAAEDLSRRIAYFHSPDGADKGGWDLSQLLRVPFTYNMKYGKPQPVRLLDIHRSKYRPSDFDKYPTMDKLDTSQEPMPPIPEDLTGEQVLEKHMEDLPPQVEMLFREVPLPGPNGESQWSEALWALELAAFEAGVGMVDTFVLARDAACNKFAREGRSGHESQLWRDICRAYYRVKNTHKEHAPALEDLPDLLSDEEAETVGLGHTFIQDYMTWAKELGDAAEQYHQAGALVLLSSLISGSVRLPTSFGNIKPNLWFMILADTTLTRKTTAMDIAMDLLEEVDSSAVLATDGSIEGLMSSLAARPGRPSVFLRDEFSGLLESITKKDYMAGTAELLTKLYDGKMQKRVLKKEIIEVKDPCLVMFAGGIKNKVTGLLTTEYVSSGFIPRFVFITAESDVAKVRPLGPPTHRDTTGRQRILDILKKIHNHYFTETRTVIKSDGAIVMEAPTKWDAELTEDAWVRYNKLEYDMMQIALATENPEVLTPTYDRLCKSALKTAILLAAAEQLVAPGQKIIVDLRTLIVAIRYMEEWRVHCNKVIADIGITRDERMYQRVLGHIQKNPGKTRSMLMQRLHLNAHVANSVLMTLEQRHQIRRDKKSGGERLYPIFAKEQKA